MCVGGGGGEVECGEGHKVVVSDRKERKKKACR